MYRLLGFMGMLIALPTVKATVLYTDSTESGGVLQYGSQGISAATGGFPGALAGFAFVLPGGTYDNIGFDAPLEQDGTGTTTMAIYSDSSSNLPKTALATITIAPSTSAVTLDSGSFSGLTLTGGDTYYLVIATTALQVVWDGTPTTSTGNYYFGSTFPAGSWTLEQNLDIGAFDITGQAEAASPEPATIGEVSIGLTALLFFRKRRARWI